MSGYDVDRISSQLLWITVELWILVMLVAYAIGRRK